jgi:futalosine hydrolase
VSDGRLILVPTALEAGVLGIDDAVVCGFGLVEAAVGASRAFAERAPAEAVLVGAAGTYRPDAAPVGSVMVASGVRCEGIGVGDQSAAELGWTNVGAIALDGDGGELLSVAAASADRARAAARSLRHPEAVAEEMEGFAVALAARAFGVRLVVVRGISNVAGDRDQSRWRMREALTAARTVIYA